MTKSCCQDGARGIRLVPPKERACAEHRDGRAGRSWQRLGLAEAEESHAREPA
jgi:hypothetical protein